MTLRLFSTVLLVALAVGCGYGTANLPTEPVTPPPSPGKTVLEGMVESGEVGSGAMELRGIFEQIKAKEPAKGEALLKDLDTLQATKSPDEVKKLAAEMAAKL